MNAKKIFLLVLIFFFLLQNLFIIKNFYLKKIDYSFRNLKKELNFEKFVIVSTGDIFLHTSNIDDAIIEEQQYSFDYIFEETKELLKGSDITTCWFGGVVDTNPPFSGYPFFKSPVEILKTLKRLGFDILLRTNHVYDFGQEGMYRTNSFIQNLSLKQIGGYSTKEESEKILIFKKGNIKVAFLSYTYGTNGLIPKNKWEVNLIDFNKIQNDIEKSKKMADFVVVFFHYGNEYERKESEFQRKVAYFAASKGADIIIGSHPHVVQPLDSLILDDGRKVYTIYSLGNFYCGQRKKYTNSGIVLKVILERSKRTSEKTKLSKIVFYPTYIIKNSNKTMQKYKIVLSNNYLKEHPLDKDTLTENIKNSIEDLRELIPS
ncbi:MAG: CapA family protein, partial [candidate division WOR-3 bacterium]